MKKAASLSYLYFATGLILALYGLLNQEDQVVNVHDTYYVITANVFAFFVFLLYLIKGLLIVIIENYIAKGFKVLHYLTFTISLIYFMFIELSISPMYYLEHPLLFKWFVFYIPRIVFISFVGSFVLLVALYVVAFIKSRKTRIQRHLL